MPDVILQAATPGERQGQGLTIEYGFSPSPFGKCLIADSPRGLVRLDFVDNNQHQQAIDTLKAMWKRADMKPRNDQRASDRAAQLFNICHQPDEPLRAFVKGTNFQLKVWRALLEIEPGQVLSYGQVAERIGRPGAARPVGQAIGANPLAYVIPCHRVIGANRALGGYGWGLNRKRFMLAYENVLYEAIRQ